MSSSENTVTLRTFYNLRPGVPIPRSLRDRVEDTISRHRGPRHARFSRDGVGHRGAKPERRYELEAFSRASEPRAEILSAAEGSLLAPISLLSPAYLLSVERWPFHAAGVPVPRAFRGMGWDNHRITNSRRFRGVRAASRNPERCRMEPTFVSARLVGLAVNHAYAFGG